MNNPTTTHHPWRDWPGLPIAALLALPSLGQAAGFALIEQSVSSMGTAYAGSAAAAEDSSTLYFNPAGMTRLPGTRASVGLHAINTRAEFDGGATFGLTGADIPGGDGGDAGALNTIPHLYVTHQLSGQSWLGLAVNVPFGLATEYDDDWFGRYHAIESEVSTVNINPSFAVRLNPKLSLGLGVSAQYIDAELSNAIDYGSLNLIPASQGGLGGALGPAVGPGGADGKANLEGDAWSWGWNVGVLFELSDRTRVGAHYRSEVDQDLDGSAKFATPGGPLTTDVEASVDLPATFSLSLVHELNAEWALMADYTWTGWSSLPELRFDFANGLPDGVTTLEWDDTNRYSLGATYTPAGSVWVFRAGVALDETPIPDAAHRTPRIPGDDRLWVALGAGYSPTKHWRFDFGYAHLFVDNPEIDKPATPGSEDFLRGALVGSYDASVDILSAQMEYRFD
ncbi:MAG: outer membrane protein transport protein [Gammaproteobacteria bacterium]